MSCEEDPEYGDVGENRETRLLTTGVNRRDALKLAGASLLARSRTGWSTSLASSPAAPAQDSTASRRGDLPLIFPHPRQIETSGTAFTLDREATIIAPANAAKADLFLAQLLTEDLSDRLDLQLRTERMDRLPEGRRVIVMGSAQNPLIRAACDQYHLELSENKPGPEGYILRVTESVVVIGGSDDAGAFYGLQSLRQLVRKDQGKLLIPAVDVRDWPAKPFRGIKLYVPGPDHITYYKHFVRDFAALYKFNALSVEMNACMRLDRHPELNAGWIEFARDTNWSRRNYPPGPLHGREQNSSHQDCGDGAFIEKSEVAALARVSRERYIDFIPEIPSLTHSFYLLARHKDLSDVPGDKWPDTYCPSNPQSYDLLFDVMDEFIEVTRPKMVHAGHDEWFAPFGLCPRCRGKDPGELYGRDLRRIHEYLAKQNIRMAIWGDYLLENVRGRGLQRRVAPDGWVYYSPGAMTPQQVRALVPKDILIFNWFWSEEEKGEQNEAQLEEFGFRQVYGNMEPEIHNYVERSQRATIIGGAPSSWAATTAFNMNKDLLYSILGSSEMLWSGRTMNRHDLCLLTQNLIPLARFQLTGGTPPSNVGDPVVPIDIAPYFNQPVRESLFGVDLSDLASGRLRLGNKLFALSAATSPGTNAVISVGTEGSERNSLPREVRGIKIGADATSLIFLHACARPAANRKAYRLIWDPADSADLLGWYEIVYRDGFTEIAPIRYGINILEWNWSNAESAGKYCYDAELLNCSKPGGSPANFFAYEWTSPRLGKVVEEVRLKGSTRFRGAVPGFENRFGEVISSNAIMLKAISYVPRRGSKGQTG
jgi:Glycosyl hydrolase family 20, domain 2/Glycosyl hydrolase family 20, catalytic domain